MPLLPRTQGDKCQIKIPAAPEPHRTNEKNAHERRATSTKDDTGNSADAEMTAGTTKIITVQIKAQIKSRAPIVQSIAV